MRRHPVTRTVAVLLLVALWATACDDVRLGTGGPRRPNVLVIVTDDQRMDPATFEVMPRTMELFRDQGRTFTNAVVTTPLCCPSRASILSGRYAHNHGVLINPDGDKLDQSLTLHKELGDAGYQTAVVGKYLQGYAGDPRHFDRWAVFQAEKKYYGNNFNIDGREGRIDEYVTTVMHRHTMDILADFGGAEEPWLLYLAVYPPHIPATPAPEHRGAPVPAWKDTPANTERDIGDKPRYVRRNARRSPARKSIKRQRRKELRSLMAVDELVADVFAWMEDNGEDDTLAFLISDNGYLHLEHQVWRKRYPYNESVRVPMFVRWPGEVEEGGVDERIVANIDIAATVYDALEVEPSYEVDGRSLFQEHERDDILLEFFAEVDTPSWAALWTPDRQYIEYDSGAKEYYGPNDPWQLDNAYGNDIDGDEPDDEEELSRRLAELRGCVGARCP